MICYVCKREFDKKEINRIFGKDSLVSLIGVCSAQCYTKRNDPHFDVINSIKKIRIYVDMDGVLFDYWKRFRELQNDLIRLPQTTYGFYTSLEPIDGAIEAFKWLWEHFEVFILTRPSYQNPMCYTEKRVCVENHLGIEAAKNLIISYDKTLFIGDALIDDTQCDGFQGEMILFGSERFGNWTTVIKYLSQNYLND